MENEEGDTVVLFAYSVQYSKTKYNGTFCLPCSTKYKKSNEFIIHETPEKHRWNNKLNKWVLI